MIQCRPQDSEKGELLDIRETQRVEYTLQNVASDEWMLADESNCPVLGGESTFPFSDAIKYLKRGMKVARKGWNGKKQYIQLATGISYTFWRQCCKLRTRSYRQSGNRICWNIWRADWVACKSS